MWVKIDDGIATHPKIISAGFAALALQIRAICYASQHKTDGVITKQTLPLLTYDLPQQDWPAVMMQHRLWEQRDDVYIIHDYLEWNLSRKECEAMQKALSKAGKRGMKSRWSKHQQSDNLGYNPPNNQTITLQSTSIATSKSLNSLKNPDPEFEQFWSAYPKKVGKKDAARAWAKAKDKPALPDILSALSRAGQSAQWKKEHGQYIPNPATWINQGRWSDQPMTNGTESLTCQDCHKVFPDPAALRTHRFAYHPKWEG